MPIGLSQRPSPLIPQLTAVRRGASFMISTVMLVGVGHQPSLESLERRFCVRGLRTVLAACIHVPSRRSGRTAYRAVPLSHIGLHRDPGAMPDPSCPHFESCVCMSIAQMFRVQLLPILLTIDGSMQAMQGFPALHTSRCAVNCAGGRDQEIGPAIEIRDARRERPRPRGTRADHWGQWALPIADPVVHRPRQQPTLRCCGRQPFHHQGCQQTKVTRIDQL
jgi:hypothetical protein